MVSFLAKVSLNLGYFLEKVSLDMVFLMTNVSLNMLTFLDGKLEYKGQELKNAYLHTEAK